MAKTLKGFDFTQEEIRNAIKNGSLLQASINISRRCNFKCLYCLMNAGEPRDNELNNSEIKRVLKQARDLGTKTWYIAGDGEPLKVKGIEGLIDYANNLGMWVVLATNGELLTEEKARELKQKNISIITKFNGFNQKVFNELVQTKATFVKYSGLYVPRGVASLLKTGYNATTPTRAGIETVITTRNIGEIPKVYEFAQKHNLYANVETMLPIGRASEHSELMPSNEQIRALYAELDKIRGNYSAREDVSHYEGIDCSARLKYSVYSNSAGEVFLCFNQHPNLSTGMNVRDFSLKEIIGKRKFPEIPAECACEYFTRK